MNYAFALSLFGLVCADVANGAAASDRGTVALVAVALPVNANPAMLEALNRLRGEATSVGFEVRFIDTASESVPLVQIESLSRGLRPAAVVAFGGPEAGAQVAHSLDVWFLDRVSGKTSVAHFAADEDGATGDRNDVIIAVRAVDFIRARMFDTLSGRQTDLPQPKKQQTIVPVPRYYIAGGIGVLATLSGFQPAVAPQIAVGYRLTSWGRIDAMALGLGTRPRMDSSAGQVNLDQRFVGASMTLLGPEWYRLRPIAEMGAGEYFVVVHGSSPTNSPGVGQDITLSSLGALLSLGIAVNVLPHLVVELRGGTLWLENESRINSDEATYLGSVGRPSLQGSFRVGTTF